MDQMVLRAQRFVNSYSVAGIPKVDEDGITGWQVMYALTRALQHELGITALSNSFGSTTLARLTASFPLIDGRNRQGNINRIIQSGLYCKGYDGGEIDGVYNSRVAASVVRLKQDAGVAGVLPGDGVSPKLFKAILTLDAYVLVGGGTTQIQGVQRWLNAGYLGRRDFYIIPSDGVFSRDVQKALVHAIQFDLGMSDDVATGALGQLTRDGLRQQTVGSGSTGAWVNLFTAAMIFNKRPGVVFSSTYTAALATSVRVFQEFVKLPVTGNGDYRTWMSLLVSTGDPERKGTACDCVSEITAARAATLLSEGYQVVGRYLTNVPGSTLDKKIKRGELATMSANGLRFFPIYQTYGNSAAYFNIGQGRTDAFAAIDAARSYGFRAGTRIYFAVDYDAFDTHVTSSIIPHFRGINEIMSEYGAEYRVGVYAPRNVCSRVAAAGLSSASFVCGMSTGFSGNLGFPLPGDWAFDQIAEYPRGSGDGRIEIDNNIASGRDNGQSVVDAVPPVQGNALDVRLATSARPGLLADIQVYLESLGIPEGPRETPPVDFAFRPRSTTECVDIVLGLDYLITDLSRTLRMRKSLLQTPLMWELRYFSDVDVGVDAAVRNRYINGTPGPEDSSTGVGQIFARTAIRARNYCIGASIVSGVLRDPDKLDDVWAAWLLLQDNELNVRAAAEVLIHAANIVPAGVVRRPALDYDESETEKVLARYNGTGDEAQAYGVKTVGLYRIFEKHNSAARAGS